MAIFRDTGLVANGIYLIDTLIWDIAKQHAIYVIQSSDLTALIDTGLKRTRNFILERFRELNITTIDYILVTHSHIDHSGAIHYLAQKFPNAKVGIPHLAHQLKQIYDQKKQKLNLENPLQLLREGTTIKLDSKYVLKVLETPGHSSDHISFLEQNNQVLFVGDACGAHHLGKNFSRPTAYAPDFQHEAYIQSLYRFQKINPAGLALASFGFATNQDAQKCIEIAISDYYNWKQVVIEAMDTNPDAPYVAEVLLKTFGRSPGEMSENRPAHWVKRILGGIAHGFINSLGLKKK